MKYPHYERPMKSIGAFLSILFAVILLSPYSVAAKSINWTKQWYSVGIYTPSPDYPIQARRMRIASSGVFVLFVNEAGIVTEVGVPVSSRSPILDKAAISALKKWRFKPGTGISLVRVPITWAL